jgi:hypothetical protein
MALERILLMAAPAPAVPKKSAETAPGPTEEQIRRRAHEIYMQRGPQDGHELDDWLQAETELRETRGEDALEA